MHDIDRRSPTVDRFATTVQERNRETLKEYHVQMVLEDRAEFATYPLWLVEPEGSA
jgi:hypothetical protein